MGDRIVRVDATVKIEPPPQGTTVEGFRFLYASAAVGGGYPFSLQPAKITSGIASHFTAEADRGANHNEPDLPSFVEEPPNFFTLRMFPSQYADNEGALSDPLLRPGIYDLSAIQINLKTEGKDAQQFLWKGLDFGSETYPSLVISDSQVNKPIRIVELKASDDVVGQI